MINRPHFGPLRWHYPGEVVVRIFLSLNKEGHPKLFGTDQKLLTSLGKAFAVTSLASRLSLFHIENPNNPLYDTCLGQQKGTEAPLMFNSLYCFGRCLQLMLTTVETWYGFFSINLIFRGCRRKIVSNSRSVLTRPSNITKHRPISQPSVTKRSFI